MKRLVARIVAVVFLAGVAGSLSGCVGSNAVTGKVMKFNLEIVDNRYARGGLNMLLAPVYGITVFADTLVFNSIEFWTGKNPINGKPHIFDSDIETIYNINDNLAPSLKKAPVDPLSKSDSAEKEVYSAQMNPVNENTIDFHIVYTNGEKAVIRGERDGNMVTFMMDGEIITITTMAELEAFVKAEA